MKAFFTYLARVALKPQLAETADELPEPLRNLLANGATVGKSGKTFPKIAAASTVSNLLILRRLLRAYRPARTLEVGMAFGASTCVFADYHAQRAQAAGSHIAIDPFQATVWDGVGVKFLESADLGKQVRVMTDFSSQVLPTLVAAGESIEMAYIDGSHLFEDVFVDFYYLDHLLLPGGVMLFDDSTHADVQKVISFIRRNHDFRYEPIDLRYCYSPDALNGFRYTALQTLRKNQLTVFRKTRSDRRSWDAPFRNF
jgi:predicted O-methyltransferase YrrM